MIQMADISNTNTKISRYTYLDMYKRYKAWTTKTGKEPNIIYTKKGGTDYVTLSRFKDMQKRFDAYWREHNAQPSYVCIVKPCEPATKSAFHLAVEKAIGTYNNFTEYYNRIKAKTWTGYYNDVYSQSEEIQRLSQNKSLNCTDHSQLGMAVLKDLNYEGLYCRVTCKSGGHIILKVRGKELGTTYRNVDLAAAASSDYPLGSYWCSSYAKPVVIDESWINKDDGEY